GVAAQAAVGQGASLAAAARRRGVVEAAVRILCGKRRRVVLAFQVLAPAHKDQRFLQRLAVGVVAGGLEGLDQETGIGEIGPAVVAVACAAVGRIRLVLVFAFVPLEPLKIGVGLLEDRIVAAIAVGFGKRHH